ncbi:MAG: molybdopterin molybdotransferase MoeA [Coriobacteriales bacterium]|jgi:molybdopterin molybdotransferase|nr:molybdopterin molybdotransferase MoeA [Coriobacteriales bacterium]
MSNRYEDTQMIGVEEARAVVLAQVAPLPAEQVGIVDAAGRVLAQDVVSDIDIAPFDSSAMDGFAVRYDDFTAAGDVSEQAPLTLEVIGLLGAGSVFEGTVGAGQALRIMTGAPLPAGIDTVVKIEDTQVRGEGEATPAGTQVVFTKTPARGEHVRLHGEEAHAGDALLHIGDRVSSAAAGLLASTGTTTVAVYRRPRVAVFSTGNELVSPDEVPGPGQIRNSNSYALAAAIHEAGATATLLPRVEDTPEALRATLETAVQDHDVVVLSGGAAEGDFDYTTAVVRELGEMLFNKVAMRPGKAQTFALIHGVPVFGLPGNPAASVVGFEILVRPALLYMQGITTLDRPITRARVTQDVKKKEPRRFYLRARLERAADGGFDVTPEKNQSSALFSALNRSNCLLIVPYGLEPLTAGDEASCLRLDIDEGTVV